MSHRSRPDDLANLAGIGRLIVLAKAAGCDLDSHEISSLSAQELEELIAEHEAAKLLNSQNISIV